MDEKNKSVNNPDEEEIIELTDVVDDPEIQE